MKYITIIGLTAALMFTAACSTPQKEAVNSTPVSASGANTPQTSPTPVAPANNENEDNNGITSVYSDIAASKCKTIESNEDEAWIVQRCPGKAGYDLEVYEGDLRQSINLITPEKKKIELDFPRIVASGFSSLGEKAEWRMKNVNGQQQPFALIVRYNVDENSEESAKPVSYLVVTKITPNAACITDVVEPVPEANKRARELADNSGEKPCKTGK